MYTDDVLAVSKDIDRNPVRLEDFLFPQLFTLAETEGRQEITSHLKTNKSSW